MMNDLEDAKRSGKFTISPGEEMYGELTLKRAKTCLRLQNEVSFSLGDFPDQCITGLLNDLTKVSLFQCIIESGLGSGWRGDRKYYYANIFPHYVIYGDSHLTPAEKSIASVHLV